MSNTFQNVPVEKGTRIHVEKEIRVGEMDTLHQVWSWDGVHAESIVFHNHDVQTLSDDEVQRIVREHLKEKIPKDGKMTLSRSESGFTFVNFNFTY